MLLLSCYITVIINTDNNNNNTCPGREGGVRIPESDVERVVGLLLQDSSVAALVDKVQSVGRFTEEAESTLAR